ncbi:unnamed protein product (macronuclear) [Paramecium tetraurelia]|uniref:Ubiquitin-like domain-containing protein n=1 Tax=Paramecium tetraurelia TaxID=5888 RepID=A0DQ65_PARTE|nr:uncharacterized protein GSPATT00002582001 [Paramecium tetraurelia]CAK85182.1 unnamed protein product [Paramecium tetraurelia]|eukprot:XP_001452579.1 hypothetical protein (macronuclear) [Paramecium tetraurelia strain d4-2]
MLKLQVRIKEEAFDFEISKNATIAELKALIVEQQKITASFDLYIFDQLLLEEGTVNKIIYNCKADNLEVRFKEKLQAPKFQHFYNQAKSLVMLKTIVSTIRFLDNLVELKKQRTQDSDKVSKVLSSFENQPKLIKHNSSNLLTNFPDRLKEQPMLSHIKMQEDDQVRNQNNDTVLNILNNMINEDKRENLHKMQIKSNKQKYQALKFSPQKEEYLIRKKKALSSLQDPNQCQKAKLLIQELKKQKEQLQLKRQEHLDNSAEKRGLSLEHQKEERELLKQQINQEKRNRIVERLNENQKNHELLTQFNKQSQQLINELKNRMKKHQDSLKSKDEQLKQIYFEDAKLKLQEKRKQAQPIRLLELNQHEEHYLVNREMLKLQRDQKKLEWEIKIKSETKLLYKDQKVLQEVMKSDQQLKNKDIIDLKKKQEFKVRKQKYSEIIQEFHRPSNFSKIEGQQSMNDNSINESRDFQLRQAIRYRNKSQLLDSLVNTRVQAKMKKIQSALSQQHITPKTKITESLQQGKVPEPSTYFHLRVHTPPQKVIIQEESQIKKQQPDYLSEFKRERKSMSQSALTSHSSINKKLSVQQEMRLLQKLEEEAKKKEQLAQISQNDDLQIEATDLYLKSVQAKLQYLDKKLSNF